MRKRPLILILVLMFLAGFLVARLTTTPFQWGIDYSEYTAVLEQELESKATTIAVLDEALFEMEQK